MSKSNSDAALEYLFEHEGEVKVDARYLYQWAAMLEGARKMLPYVDFSKVVGFRKDWKVYGEALRRLVESDMRSLYRFMVKDYEFIGFRNHKSGKNGRLVWCEAYFM